jgi:hypothetical protein
MKALTLCQPWAWAIFYAGKDVENRSWDTKYRGPLLIHAAAKWHKEEWPSFSRIGSQLPGPGNLIFGAIIGVVDLTDIFMCHRSKWAFPDCLNWVFKNPRAFDRPIPCKGMQKIWTPDETTMERVRAQL